MLMAKGEKQPDVEDDREADPEERPTKGFLMPHFVVDAVEDEQIQYQQEQYERGKCRPHPRLANAMSHATRPSKKPSRKNDNSRFRRLLAEEREPPRQP